MECIYFGAGLKLRRSRSEDRHPNYTLLYYSRIAIFRTSLSLMCVYYQSKKKDQWTTLFQRRVYKAYSAVGSNTNHSQTPWIPHGSRPHGYDRRWALCGKDPVCSKVTPALQPPPWPDEDLSLLGSETYSDAPTGSNAEWEPQVHKYFYSSVLEFWKKKDILLLCTHCAKFSESGTVGFGQERGKLSTGFGKGGRLLKGVVHRFKGTRGGRIASIRRKHQKCMHGEQHNVYQADSCLRFCFVLCCGLMQQKQMWMLRG
jgi:hypothetical protein